LIQKRRAITFLPILTIVKYIFRWKFKAEKLYAQQEIQTNKIRFRNTPAIDEEKGRVYAGIKGNQISKFIAFDMQSGELCWEHGTGGDVYSSSVIYGDKVLCVRKENIICTLITEKAERQPMSLDATV